MAQWKATWGNTKGGRTSYTFENNTKSHRVAMLDALDRGPDNHGQRNSERYRAFPDSWVITVEKVG